MPSKPLNPSGNPKIDNVTEASIGMTEEEYAQLAMHFADQAGCTPGEQRQILTILEHAVDRQQAKAG